MIMCARCVYVAAFCSASQARWWALKWEVANWLKVNGRQESSFVEHPSTASNYRIANTTVLEQWRQNSHRSCSGQAIEHPEEF
jgi:hypothetical protein